MISLAWLQGLRGKDINQKFWLPQETFKIRTASDQSCM